MAAALKEAGFELDETEIQQRIAAEQPIGRPHLAQAVLSAPANAERLQAEEIGDIGALIRGYLIEGKPAFRMRQTPTVAQAVEAIHEADGVAVWAHPFWDISDPDEVLTASSASRPWGWTAWRSSTSPTRASRPSCSPSAARARAAADGLGRRHGPENPQFHSSSWRSTPTGSSRSLGPIDVSAYRSSSHGPRLAA